MKISTNWLRTFVDFDESPEKIADIITHLAFECDSITQVHRNVDGVVVGKILESNPHPNADKLQMTRVDVGGETLDIACGAPNCRAGLLVPVAKPGAVLDGITIEARKIRGERSEGMILSEKEMGISDDHSGVIELTDDYTVGTPFSEYLEADDTILDFEITVNRPDALSHLGMARELAAYFRRPLKRPGLDVTEVDRPASNKVKIEIRDAKEGPRYVARMVEGVNVGPSPLWMKALLHSLGQRPINNIVDITNYVLFELGHPLHAFDYHLVKEGHVVVRLAEAGESFVTLDDKERTLDAGDLLIADPEKGIALAGVMGGANSEVKEDTRDVLIEAAYFDPPNIRRTSKRHGLSTEASRRFERGADPSMPPLAAARCAELMRTYAGGEVLKGLVDAYPSPIQPRTVTLRPSRATQVLGMDIKVEQALDVLNALELKAEAHGKDEISVQVPTFRPDLEREIDLVEEVVRLIGYDEVPTARESRIILDSPDSPLDDLVDTAVDTFVAMGFREATSSGMTSMDDQLAFEGGLDPYEIHRPLNPEMNAYRASLVPPLLRALERNLNRGAEDVRLAEAGQVGGMGWFGLEGSQRMHLAFAVCGASTAPSYDRQAQEFDLADLKAVLEGLAVGLSLDKPLKFSYDTPANLMYGVTVLDGSGQPLVIAGQLKPEIAERFGIETSVFIGEIDLERWSPPVRGQVRLPGTSSTYKPFSRFPASTRDVAFIVPRGVQTGEVVARIVASAGDLLEDATLFDLYEGKPLAKGERSLAYRLVFRAPDRTLTDDEVDPLTQAVIEAVEGLDGVRIRS